MAEARQQAEAELAVNAWRLPDWYSRANLKSRLSADQDARLRHLLIKKSIAEEEIKVAATMQLFGLASDIAAAMEGAAKPTTFGERVTPMQRMTDRYANFQGQSPASTESVDYLKDWGQEIRNMSQEIAQILRPYGTEEGLTAASKQTVEMQPATINPKPGYDVNASGAAARGAVYVDPSFQPFTLKPR
jgi:hypothetical protein